MRHIDTAVSMLFRDQHGLVLRGQLLPLGYTDRQIQSRLSAGEWRQVHRGVYRSSASPMTAEQRLLAACFAAGPRSVASHASAAWLWGLLDHAPERPTLSIPRPAHPRLRGVELHRPGDLDPSRISYRKGIPCTDPLRALVDLAATADRELATGALDQALSTRLVSGRAVAAELERRTARGRRGVRPLREIMAGRGIIGAPRASVLERQTLQLLNGWRIPVTGHEVRAGPDDRYRLDFLLLPPVAMEVDGYTYHWSPEAKARDEARRNRLRLDGIFLLVYTFLDVRHDRARMFGELTMALARYARAASRSADDAPPGHGLDIECSIDIGFGEEPPFKNNGAQVLAFGHRGLDDLGRLLVADVGVEGRSD
jgi:hypothetical protein